MTKISWRRVISAILILMGVFLLSLGTWLYVRVFLLYQEGAANLAGAEALEAEVRAKYCTQPGPYKNEGIEKLCTTGAQ